MDVPGIVRERVGDERRMTSVNVGGDDRVYVTPPRTLVYHASGLFSRESIDEYSHDAQRFDVSASRREATFAFEYDDGVEAFSVPRERIETVLPPVLAGVLRTTGHIDDDESIEESYRFGERTVVVTEGRVLTSVGEAVWDHDHDSYAYADVTDLTFDDGDLVIVIDGRSRRIELDDDTGYEAYETVESALLAYHGVESVDDLGSRPAEKHRPADESPSSDVGSAAGNFDSPTGTTPPSSESTEPEPLSGRTDTSSEAANQPADAERADVADDIQEDDSSTTASPPPSSPAPGGPATDPLIPEAPDFGGTDHETHEASTNTDDSVPDAEPATSTDPPENATSETAPSSDTPDLTDELDALRDRVDQQHRLLERNQELLERLVEAQESRRVSDGR